MRFLFTLLVCTCAIYSLAAQCTRCEVPQDQFSDYCFSSEQFDDLCLQFSEGAEFFRLIKGKKIRQLAVSETYGQSYLLGLARDKKLKVSAAEMLFLQEGTAKWQVEKRKFGHEYTDSGLGFKILREGTGGLPELNKPIKVHYAGYLEDGTKFDSSFDRNEPIEFVLGQGQVIKGWDEGVAMLKKGTQAVLRIPPNLGYGSRARGPIPANATLYFEIEVIDE